jgi:hypothetical protein
MQLKKANYTPSDSLHEPLNKRKWQIFLNPKIFEVYDLIQQLDSAFMGLYRRISNWG